MLSMISAPVTRCAAKPHLAIAQRFTRWLDADIDDPLGYVCRWGENGSGAVARVIDPFRKSSIRTDGKCRDAQCDRQATMR